MEAQDALVESYSNIMTYSKPGLTEGSYYVYVYFDATLTDIATPAPSLREFYLITNEEGNLVWANNTSDEQQALIEQYRTDDDVQALVEDVNTKYQQAIDSDEALKNLLESGTSSAVRRRVIRRVNPSPEQRKTDRLSQVHRPAQCRPRLPSMCAGHRRRTAHFTEW